MSTKPFDATKPVQQRNGRAAIIKATDSKGTCAGKPYPIVADIKLEHGDAWHTETFTSIGETVAEHERPTDLINIPTPREWWQVRFADTGKISEEFKVERNARQYADDLHETRGYNLVVVHVKEVLQ
jgi:hypothetical protein